MNLMINGLPKINFKAAQPISAGTNQMPQANQVPVTEPLKEDTFTKTNSTQAPVYSQPSVTKAPEYPKPEDTVKTSIFYINDIHGRLSSMRKIATISNAFDNYKYTEPVDTLKLASGDMMIGTDKKLNSCVNLFLNSIGITSNVLGNHEFNASPADIAKVTQNSNYKLLGMNLHVAADNPLYSRIEKSYVEEKNGHKYGIIGISPPDLYERIGKNEAQKQVMVDDFEKTIKDVQNEVDKFKAQGINKIILLSHCGLKKDQQMAKTVSGVDVILGAHTHELIKDIEKDVNLFNSKTGEPVVITQAGKDGEHMGVLNLEFNKDGVITKVQNNVINTSKFKSSRILNKAFDMVLGKPEYVGEIKYAAPPPEYRLIEPNPHANIIMDAMRHEMGTDLALMNAGNIRGFFEEGSLNSRQVFEVTPLKSKIVVLKLNEKEVVDGLKNGAKSLINPGYKPSVVIQSGLKYTVNRKGEVLSAVFIDKQGKEIPIDINNPNPNKIYTVATDDFFASGGDNLIVDKMTNKEYDKMYDFDKDKLTCDYIKKMNQPIEIRDDGRYKIVD